MARIAIGTLLALMLVAAAAYAASSRGGAHGKERHEPAGKRHEPGTATSPDTPVATPGSGALRIPGHPPAIATQSTARFRVEAPGEPMLRCRIDKRPAQACDESPLLYRGVGVGSHTFYVQAQRRGRVIAHASFSWTVLEPKPFTIVQQPAAIGPLYPGETPSTIPVLISNPNPVPITITSLKVSAGGGAPGCDPAANLALTAPALTRTGLRIAARGSVSLPTTKVAAPTIALRELPVPQDACQNASFNLAFSGSAGG